jgi:cysteine sulfinate desulfinase/cysteine desulfurase-like protein
VPINFTVRRGGICICTEEFRFTALVFGGEQERHASGTEAVHQIGMAKALELSYDNLEEEGSDF